MTKAFDVLEDRALRTTGIGSKTELRKLKYSGGDPGAVNPVTGAALPKDSRLQRYEDYMRREIRLHPSEYEGDSRASKYLKDYSASTLRDMQRQELADSVDPGGIWDDWGAGGGGGGTAPGDDVDDTDEPQSREGQPEEQPDSDEEEQPEEELGDEQEPDAEATPDEEAGSAPEGEPSESGPPEGLRGTGENGIADPKTLGKAPEGSETAANVAKLAKATPELGEGASALAGAGAAAPEAAVVVAGGSEVILPVLAILGIVILLVVLFTAFYAKYPEPASANTIKDAIICLDAGHPPNGAGGEPELNLKVAQETQKELESRGYKVVMTRTDSNPVSISARPNTCAQANATFMYSFHADGSARTAGYPYQIYMKSDRDLSSKSKSDAETIQKFVSKAISGSSGLKDGGICQEGSCTLLDSLGIFSGADTAGIPAVLTEMVQLNDDGISALDDSATRQKLVKGIANGIESLYPASSGASSTPTGGSTRPKNVISKGSGWTLKPNTDYSKISCAIGTTDSGTYKHPVGGFTIRKCKTSIGIVASIVSQRTIDMINAAKKDGISLTGSGFRTYEQQQSEYRSNCSGGYCNPPTARPGNSQHERGLALDLENIGRVGSGKTWNWMVKNGKNYGYINLPSEGWHWSMSGN